MRLRHSGLHLRDLSLEEFELAFETVLGWEASQFCFHLGLPSRRSLALLFGQMLSYEPEVSFEFTDLRRLGSSHLIGGCRLASSFG